MDISQLQSLAFSNSEGELCRASSPSRPVRAASARRPRPPTSALRWRFKALRVAVVDADIGLRNLDVVMGLENRIVYDLVDVVEGRCRLRQALIKDKHFPRSVPVAGGADPR